MSDDQGVTATESKRLEDLKALQDELVALRTSLQTHCGAVNSGKVAKLTKRIDGLTSLERGET